MLTGGDITGRSQEILVAREILWPLLPLSCEQLGALAAAVFAAGDVGVRDALGPPIPFAQAKDVGRPLLDVLTPGSWQGLSRYVRLVVLSSLRHGLTGGLHAAVRLRISCGETSGLDRSVLVFKLLAVIRWETSQLNSIAAPADTVEQKLCLTLLGSVLGGVCAAGVGVSELRAIFALLRESKQLPLAAGSLLQALLFMMNPQDLQFDASPAVAASGFGDPIAFFSFHHASQGLVLRGAKWPLERSGEYQLVVCLRLESTDGSHVGPMANILSLRLQMDRDREDEGDVTLNYFFRGSCLCLRVAGGGRPIEELEIDLGDSLTPRRWHTFVIQHGRKKGVNHFFRKNPSRTSLALRIFMNDHLVFDGPAPLPALPASSCSSRLRDTVCFMGGGLNGQIGYLLLGSHSHLSCSAAMEAAASTAGLAFGHYPCHPFTSTSAGSGGDSSASVLSKISAFATAAVSSFPSTPGSPHFMSWLPDLSRGDQVHEAMSGLPAKLHAGAVCWEVRNPKDMLASMGGIAVLLPLFISSSDDHSIPTVDQLLRVAAADGGGQSLEGVYPLQSPPLPLLLRVLSSFLNGHEANQADMERICGLDILEACLLMRPKALCRSSALELVREVQRLCYSCGSATSNLRAAALHKFAWQLAPWQWILPMDLQTGLFSELARMESNPDNDHHKKSTLRRSDAARGVTTCIRTLLGLKAQDYGALPALKDAFESLLKILADAPSQEVPTQVEVGRLLLIALSALCKREAGIRASVVLELIQHQLSGTMAVASATLKGMELACTTARVLVDVPALFVGGVASFAGLLVRLFINCAGHDLRGAILNTLWSCVELEQKVLAHHSTGDVGFRTLAPYLLQVTLKQHAMEVGHRTCRALLDIAARGVESSAAVLPLILLIQIVHKLSPSTQVLALQHLEALSALHGNGLSLRRHFQRVLSLQQPLARSAAIEADASIIVPGGWQISLFLTSASNGAALSLHARVLARALNDGDFSFEDLEFACSLKRICGAAAAASVQAHGTNLLRSVAQELRSLANNCSLHSSWVSASVLCCTLALSGAWRGESGTESALLLCERSWWSNAAPSTPVFLEMIDAVVGLSGGDDRGSGCTCAAHSRLAAPLFILRLCMLQCADPFRHASAAENAFHLCVHVHSLSQSPQPMVVDANADVPAEGYRRDVWGVLTVEVQILLLLAHATESLLWAARAISNEPRPVKFLFVGSWCQSLYRILNTIVAYFDTEGAARCSTGLPEQVLASLRVMLVEGSGAKWDDEGGILDWATNSSFLTDDGVISSISQIVGPMVMSFKQQQQQPAEERISLWKSYYEAHQMSVFIIPELSMTMEADSAALVEGLSCLEARQRTEMAVSHEGLARSAQELWGSWRESLMDSWSPWCSSSPCSWVLSPREDRMMRRMLLVPCHQPCPDYSGSSYESRGEEDGEDEAGKAPFTPPPLRQTNSVDDMSEENDGDSPADPGVVPLDDDTVALDREEEEEEGRGDWEEIYSDHLTELSQAADGFSHLCLGLKQGECVKGQWGDVVMVEARLHVRGTLVLTQARLLFFPISVAHAGNPDVDPELKLPPARSWHLFKLQRLYLKRFVLSPRAVELFWAGVQESFFAFDSSALRKSFIRALKLQRGSLPLLNWPTSFHPRAVLQHWGVTDAWRKREISNMEYLMHLNLLAGRSYNDLTQYPVIPWVLADYSSLELDLMREGTFRDLSKPMGALNAKRLSAFLDRYEAFSDEVVPKFMYGSHYSSCGIVLHFLVRQEPFTLLHTQLQGGRFDCPDRLFFDMQQCWKGCLTSMTDVKELVPELYCCPEVLLNSNDLPLGTLQDKRGVVGDVRLPPWASSAHEFIRKHRRALESEGVSRQLHHWIDLIFGFKQRGRAAVKFHNLFYYLTYEGAVDLDAVEDEVQREAMEAQISHFGQTPCQLFHEPHQPRLPPEACVMPCFSCPERVRVFYPLSKDGAEASGSSRGSVIAVCCSKRRAIALHANLTVTTYTWSALPDGKGAPFQLVQEKRRGLNASSIRHIWWDGPVSASHFAVYSSPAVAGGAEYLISCGYHDRSLHLHSLEGTSTFKEIACSRGMHTGRVTCIAGSPGSGFLVSGGDDCRICLWVLCEDKPALATLRGDFDIGVGIVAGAAVDGLLPERQVSGEIPLQCHKVLPGHEAAVCSIAFSADVGLCVSGAEDGHIVMHDISRGGQFVRRFCAVSPWLDGVDGLPQATKIDALVISCHGDIVAHCSENLSISLFSVNGVFVARELTACRLTSLQPTVDGEMLVCSTIDGQLSLRDLGSLAILHNVDTGRTLSPITCMQLSPRDQYLMIGHEDGDLGIAADVETRLNMISIALEKAFLGGGTNAF